ncbi:MAG: FABP family protein [Actinomycetes bacterium]
MPVELSADLPAELVPLAWLIGHWEGAGVGGYPSVESFRFGQEIDFGHIGKPFLTYVSRSWLLDDDGQPVRPLATESGYWRPQPGGAVEVMLAHPTGYAEIWLGTVTGAKIELTTDVVVRTASAKEYTGGTRLYGQVEGDLLWAFDMAAVGEQLQSHLSGRLKKVG